MSKIKFPLVKVDGGHEIIYPDDIRFFSECEYEGDWIYANYHGELSFDLDDRAIDLIVPITNIAFSGSGYDETQSDGRVDILTDTNVTLTFDIPLPDGTKLTIPVRDQNTNSLKVIRATVSGGSVNKVIKFPTSGYWTIDADEVNRMGREGVEFTLDKITLLVQDN